MDEEEEQMLLVPRRMERTLCSLLGGVGVTATGDGLEASTSSLLTCCCLTSKRDCSEETEGERKEVSGSSSDQDRVLLVPLRAPLINDSNFCLLKILTSFLTLLKLSLSAEINLCKVLFSKDVCVTGLRNTISNSEGQLR